LCAGRFGSIWASPRGLGLRREFLEVLRHDDGRVQEAGVVGGCAEVQGEGDRRKQQQDEEVWKGGRQWNAAEKAGVWMWPGALKLVMASITWTPAKCRQAARPSSSLAMTHPIQACRGQLQLHSTQCLRCHPVSQCLVQKT
jgi:hypothetical protein